MMPITANMMTVRVFELGIMVQTRFRPGGQLLAQVGQIVFGQLRLALHAGINGFCTFSLWDELLVLRGRPLGQPPRRAHSFSCSREYLLALALPPRRPASATLIGFFFFATLTKYTCG